MKTLVVTNLKGGVGKTTLSVHFAHYAGEQHARVLVLDTDSQGNAGMALGDALAVPVLASALLQKWDVGGLPECAPGQIHLMKADSTLVDLDRLPLSQSKFLAENLKKIADRYDVCVIDTPTAPKLCMLSALRAADFVICPILLDMFSLEGIAKMIGMVRGVQEDFNPGLKFLGLVPNKVNNHVPSERAALEELGRNYSRFLLQGQALTLRGSISESHNEQGPVWRLGKTSAREAGREVKRLMEALIDEMGGLHDQG